MIPPDSFIHFTHVDEDVDVKGGTMQSTDDGKACDTGLAEVAVLPPELGWVSASFPNQACVVLDFIQVLPFLHTMLFILHYDKARQLGKPWMQTSRMVRVLSKPMTSTTCATAAFPKKCSGLLGRLGCHVWLRKTTCRYPTPCG